MKLRKPYIIFVCIIACTLLLIFIPRIFEKKPYNRKDIKFNTKRIVADINLEDDKDEETLEEPVDENTEESNTEDEEEVEDADSSKTEDTSDTDGYSFSQGEDNDTLDISNPDTIASAVVYYVCGLPNEIYDEVLVPELVRKFGSNRGKPYDELKGESDFDTYELSGSSTVTLKLESGKSYKFKLTFDGRKVASITYVE